MVTQATTRYAQGQYDIATFMQPKSMTMDWRIADDGSLEIDTTLRTAIILSLFTDRRAPDGTVLPDSHSANKRGYWADALGDVEGDEFGSLIWLLAREKLTKETLSTLRQYSEDALEWMLEDNLLDEVVIQAEHIGQNTQGLEVVALIVKGYKRRSQVLDLHFDLYWRD